MAFITAAIIAGVGSLAGGYMAAQGAQGAASTQAAAAGKAGQISQQEFNTITGQEQPFMQAGYGAMQNLNYGLGVGSPTANAGAGGMGFGSLLTPFSAQMMQQYSPAYKFQLQQGMQGVLNGAASGEGALSGAAQKDLMSFNQNYANTAFNNAFNQYQAQQGNIYQRLAGIAQLGQGAAANTGQQGTALAGQAAQSATNVGTALGAGEVGAANAWSGALSNASYMPWLMDMSSTPAANAVG